MAGQKMLEVRFAFGCPAGLIGLQGFTILMQGLGLRALSGLVAMKGFRCWEVRTVWLEEFKF